MVPSSIHCHCTLNRTLSHDTGSLHSQLHTLGFYNLFLVRFQSRRHPFLDKLVHLLGCTPNKRLGVQQVVQNPPYRFKIRVVFDPLDEVVLSALLLDHPCRLVGEDADAFVSFLSVTSGVGVGICVGTRGRLCDECHDDILGCHEGQLLGDSGGDDLGVNDEAFANILKGAQDDIGCEEGLGEGDPAVCAGRNVSKGEEIRSRRWWLELGNVGIYLSSNVLSNHCTLLVISAF